MGALIHTCTQASGLPFHKHDCDKCRFVGSYFVIDEDATGRVLDVYDACDESIVIRSSDLGPDYSALPRFAAEIVANADAEWNKALGMVEEKAHA